MYSQESHPGFDLRALCDIDSTRFEQARAQHGSTLACYVDMHEMIQRKDVDAVIVATNDPCHVEPTLVALEYGKPVLVEKLLCQSVHDA
jgi:predicted dehydrogenase